MNKYFDIKDKIYDITEKYPETIDIFVANDFSQFADENMRKSLGKSISLDMACTSKKVNVELFEQKLVDAIEQNRASKDGSLVMAEKPQHADIRIDGVLPCPVKIPMLEGFEAWLKENEGRFNFTIDYELKSANLGLDFIKERIESGDESNLSDLFMSAGFDLFFDKNLMGQFKEKGVFEDITGIDQLNKDFDNEYIDLKDPLKQYTIVGVVPAIFMVNTEELKGREMPKSWEDLLKPEFESSISIPMRDLDMFNALLLNIYKKFGEEGVAKLGRSLLKSMHPAEMVKAHTKKSEFNMPAITVMPYFFTRMVQENSPMKPVWPEDGAIISPIFLLSKKDSKERIKPFLDFFFSKEIGEILSFNGKMPSTHPAVDNGLSEEQKFMWVGWDFINSNDIGGLIKKCEQLFNGVYEL